MPEVTVLSEGVPASDPAARVPSIAERILADANRVEEKIDDLGRSIKVRKLEFLDIFDLSLMMGESEVSSTSMNMASAAMSVVSIAGEELPPISDLLGLRALMKRLGFHGLRAAAEALKTFNIEKEATQDAIKN